MIIWTDYIWDSFHVETFFSSAIFYSLSIDASNCIKLCEVDIMDSSFAVVVFYLRKLKQSLLIKYKIDFVLGAYL